MNKFLGWLSWVITARPYVTILVLLVITVSAGSGRGSVEGGAPPETEATLPKGSPITDAMKEIDELFGESGETSVVTLIFRGETLTPDGLSQMDALINEVVGDPAVSGLLAPTDPVIAPSQLVQTLLQVQSFESVTEAKVQSADGPPEIKGALEALTGTDTDGTRVSIANIRLRDTGDERVEEAERRIHELAVGSEGRLDVSSLSPVIIEDEYKEATETGMLPLIGIAFLLIAALLLLFMRTITDLLLTLAGLLMALIWIVGAEGWLGPNALGLTGPPNSLTTMVPIIVISLTVDYAIQMISHYREQRNAGLAVAPAIRTGLRNVILPLVLAAVTTIASLLVSLFSTVEIVGDFGIIGGMGVGLSLIVMLTLVPAGRTIIDRRREARGKLKSPRPIAQALPGVERLAEILGRNVTRRPAPFLLVVLAITVGFGFAATDIESEFSIRDILPRGGELRTDMDTLEASVGGSTEMVSVIVKAEATETRTLLNMQDLERAFEDERRRPQAAAGPIVSSYELLIRDWTHDSGAPGDKFDETMASLYRDADAGLELNPVKMQALIDRMEELDPATAHVLVDNPDGIDALLFQFPAFNDDPAVNKVLQDEIEELWAGDDEAITATSLSLVSVTVTDAITNRQTEAITTTVGVALAVLGIFFWVTLRQPILAVFAVGPIVLVLIWVLGTMALLDIPYSLVTSIITALSIGIGVDYTIHIIHRYREEFARLRNPERAAIKTLATTGSALLGSALTTGLGLGVLVFSPLDASRDFGITAAITIVYSLIVSILVVPTAMTVWGAYQNMRLRSMVERMWTDLDVAIDDIHRRHEQEQESQ